MVPVQRYIVCKDKHQKPIISEDKTSYVWAHDLSDELKKAPKFTFGWDYSKSERYIFFEINENKFAQNPVNHSCIWLIFI
ncbi:Uncharacterised protein [Legionella feeleii]|uniref:Uncharacterized protein n=2 Tax=Legionella feeleii TaxID=453 RepID=A0A2X1QMS9_9GAMM|nr:Uncharacterised protein [Legionella feeleii]